MKTLAQYAVGIAASAALLVGCGGRSQYVSNGNSGNVSAFAINASSGALRPLKSSPFAAGSYAFPRHAYVSACNGRRNGVAQCGVIVRSTGVRADTPSGWSPADLQSAYKLPSSTKGKGQTVAIVDAYDNPDAASDLAEYRSTFGLPRRRSPNIIKRGGEAITLRATQVGLSRSTLMWRWPRQVALTARST
jgi:hypothetical protein